MSSNIFTMDQANDEQQITLTLHSTPSVSSIKVLILLYILLEWF